ncbi:MAG: hypothetical protein QNK05_21950 [Myxococcota bacterium]|nr:hypothetical protein [Myxococcota bacterium]
MGKLAETVVALALGSAALTVGAERSIAVPVEFRFVGTVVLADGVWAGQGDEVLGTYSLDDALAPEPSSGPSFARYSSTNNPDALFRLTVSVGSTTRTASTADDGTSADFFNSDSPDLDHWFLTFDREFAAGFARLVLVDQTPTPPDGLLPGSGGLVGTPILTPGAPTLYDLDIPASQSAFVAADSIGRLEGDLFFVLQSVTAVPEPGGALQASALVGLLCALASVVAGRPTGS